MRQQLNELEQRLLATEAKLASFKAKNEAALPETLDSRRAQLESLNARLDELDQRILLASGSSRLDRHEG